MKKLKMYVVKEEDDVEISKEDIFYIHRTTKLGSQVPILELWVLED